jgi:hypothetical protein
MMSFLRAAVICSAMTPAWADANDWSNYRHDTHRSGAQREVSALSDPAKVPGLTVRWQWPPGAAGEGGSFFASPIVIEDRVFIGSNSGRFYALDAKTGALLWQFPPPAQPPLIGSCGAVGDVQSFGAYGVLSSASQHGERVIFGAPDPDPTVDGGRGSAARHAVRERNQNLRTSRKSRRRHRGIGKSHDMTLIRADIEYPSRHCWRTQGIAPTAAMWHIGDPAHTLRWRRYASVERVKSTVTCAYSRACHERFASCRYRQHVAPCGGYSIVWAPAVLADVALPDHSNAAGLAQRSCDF